jgi:hypothetical protein
MKATTVATILLNRVIYVFGIPEATISDRGTNFCGDVIKEINRLLNVGQRLTVSHRPQADGQTERFNKTLLGMLVNYCDEKQKNWARHIRCLCYCYNNSLHKTTGFTPHELLFGFQGTLISELGTEKITPPMTPYVKDLYKNIQFIREKAYVNVTRQQASIKKQYDKRRVPPRIYEKDDLVLLHYRKALKKGLSPKLTFHARGVYKVLRKIPERDNYVIRLVNKKKGIADREITVNVDQINPFIPPSYGIIRE